MKRRRGYKKLLYEVVFETSPSAALFEATTLVRFNEKDEVTYVYVNEYGISRINLYGDQSKCIMTTFTHLMKYCYCR